jgi:DNA-binding NtrC family response regulator
VCHRINVRILAATNQELSSLSDQGRFRRDLYYRLNVARIHLPPLRERAADIASLARDCVDRITARTGRRLEGIAPEALEVLSGYPWPGNVRELRNVLETAIMTTWNSWLQVEDLPHPLREIAGREATLDERQCLLAALNACNWNKSRAAENLKWSRMTLYRKLARYQLSPKDGSSS